MRRNNFFRLLHDIFSFFPVKFPVVIFMILFCAAVNTLPSIFIQKVIALIENSDINSSWPDVSANLVTLLMTLGGL